MIVIGLTGSIGMGKSSAAHEFRRMGIPVHDADATVHRLMEPKGAAFPLLAGAFPQALRDGKIDRSVLGRLVYADAAALKRLEEILHPLVRMEEKAFLNRCVRRGCTIVVLDIPLLFETGADKRCDRVITMTAPAFLQKQRVLRRPGMTLERFHAILAKQMPDWQKRRRSDFVVPTGLGYRFSQNRLKKILKSINSHA